MHFHEDIANRMSRATNFPNESKKMYFYVRETNQSQLSQNSEGFAEHLKLQSELEQGQICIDGQSKYNVGYGDSIVLDIKPEYNLRCIKFIL